MTDISLRNIKIIKNRWPVLWQAVLNTDNILQIEFEEDSLQPTLVVNGIHLSSCFDRQKEAELQASLIPQYASQAWVYGCGMGDLPRELLQRKSLQSVNVVLLNKAVFREVLDHVDHSDWLDDPRLTLHLAEDLAMLNMPLCSASACLRIAESSAERIRDLVVLELATPYINKRIRDNETYKRQISENRDLFYKDADVAELFDSQSEAIFYVIGAGPTLSESFIYLKNRPSNVLIITVDATLKPLLNNGIVPNYVVSVDPLRDSVLSYLDIDSKKMAITPLIYFPILHRDVIQHWKGPRFGACSSSPLYEEVARVGKKGQLYSAGSVFHPAVDLAVKMGAKHVEFFGADFSYPQGRTYVSGVAFHRNLVAKRLQAQVRNGNGEMVPSSANLVGYLRDLELYIAVHPNVNFYNTSRKGAKIKGTTYIEVRS